MRTATETRQPGRRHSAGQVTLEYFLILAVIASVTILSLTTFDEEIRAAMTDFITTIANEITQP